MAHQEKTLSEKNEAFFDEIWQQGLGNLPKWVQDLSKQVTEELRSKVDWIGIPQRTQGRPVRMLDYACGSGLVSAALFNHVDQARGIDVSGTGVAEYNKQAQVLGLSQEQMFAQQGDLMMDLSQDSLLAGPDFHSFDLVVISMALHHIDNPTVALKKLVERLNKDGILLVIEAKLPSSDNDDTQRHGRQHFHGGDALSTASQHTVSRHGFEVRQLLDMMRDAGCDDTAYIELDRPTRIGDGEHTVERQGFFARGRKC